MDNKQKDDLFYVCSLIEFLVRKTNNSHKTIISYFDKAEVQHQLDVAEVNHCLTFEQVSEEIIEKYNIPVSDNIKTFKYPVPSFLAIGRLYQELISSVCQDGDVAKTVIEVFSSFICEAISNYDSSVYYSNPDYIRCSYLEGEILD